MWVPTMASGEIAVAKCWRCSSPSCTLSAVEVSQRKSSFGTSLPIRQVCPTGAIELRDNGEPEIDENRCILCGLCQVNCTVGAVQFDSTNKKMFISRSRTGTVPGTHELEVLFAEQSGLYNQLHKPNLSTIRAQIAEMMTQIQEGDSTQNLPVSDYLPRLIVNDLKALGLFPELRVRGASNLLSELVFEEEGCTVLGEIESSGDTLDSFRRLLSSASVAISRDGIKKEKVVLVLFLAALPNRRVDLYRLCGEAKRHLGVRILIVPLAALQAAVLTARDGFLKWFSLFELSDSHQSLEKAYLSTFGFSPGDNWGLTPGK